MDVAGSDPVADHRAIAAGIDRDMDAEMLADVQGVRQRVLQGCIAGYAGDADQIDRRVSCSGHQGYGIIVSGIAVKNDSGWFHRISSFADMASFLRDQYNWSQNFRNRRNLLFLMIPEAYAAD